MTDHKKMAIGVGLILGAAFGIVGYIATHPHPSSAMSKFEKGPVRTCYGTATLCAALLSAKSPAEFRAMADLKEAPSKAPARSLFASPVAPGSFRGFPARSALPASKQRVSVAPQMSVGLYYSTTTGNTETVAGYLADITGAEAMDIGDADAETIASQEALIIGAPTWHTGADTERSGTSWDEWLYGELPNMDLTGKKVAIFGVGDSASYSDNFCDATGELYDCFTAQGAKVFGMTASDDGFDYTESKGVVDGKFVGQVFDEDNYYDASEERAGAWVEQLKGEGFM